MKNLNLLSLLVTAVLACSVSHAADKIPLSKVSSVGGNINLIGQGKNTYEAMNMLDGNPGTAWAVSYEYGKCVLQLNPAAAGAEVTEILMNNGYGKDRNSFANNSRAKEISVYVNGLEPQNLIHKVTLKDQMEPQVVAIPATKNVDALFIKIESVYKGKKWNDLCISEISLQGVNHQAPAPVAGEVLKDSRDGQSYRTVRIGDQVWMAQNLNFTVGVNWCYDDKAENCQKYGRLYNWNTAMTACPAGWHLPSRAESETLVSFAGGSMLGGRKLKSTSGWSGKSDGMDPFGFNAIPAGFRKTSEHIDGFDWLGYAAFIWTTAESMFDKSDALGLFMSSGGDRVELSDENKETTGASVRCLKD